VAKARPIPGLRCEDSYALAAAKVVAVRAAELAEHSAGVLDTTDIERVHDMRVATRRLRAALEVFEPCFAPKRHKRALKDVKRLADALGERRDPDVAIEGLTEFAASVAAADRPGVESLIEALAAEQAKANERLAPLVAADWLAALEQRLQELVEGARGDAPDADGADLRPVTIADIPPPLSAPAVPARAGNGASAQ
jgi:CHAD domain-containing protein